MIDKVALATWETLYMVANIYCSSYLVGLPLGVILLTPEMDTFGKQRI